MSELFEKGFLYFLKNICFLRRKAFKTFFELHYKFLEFYVVFKSILPETNKTTSFLNLKPVWELINIFGTSQKETTYQKIFLHRIAIFDYKSITATYFQEEQHKQSMKTINLLELQFRHAETGLITMLLNGD